ncbi:MAG: glycosyltransferase family protein, partial [Limisphaerales bacterium]
RPPRRVCGGPDGGVAAHHCSARLGRSDAVRASADAEPPRGGSAMNIVLFYHPLLKSTRYRAKGFSVENALRGAELVLVHGWNDPQLVQAIGEHHRRSPNYALFFHDTHHRMVTAPESMPANVQYLGHVYTQDHNAFNCSPLAVLNVNRLSMARYGFSPPTRVFEAAGAAACLISDQWAGIELFLELGSEVLVADNGEQVAAHLAELTPARARTIGQAARWRILAEHTYARRAELLDKLLIGKSSRAVRPPDLAAAL